MEWLRPSDRAALGIDVSKRAEQILDYALGVLACRPQRRRQNLLGVRGDNARNPRTAGLILVALWE
jgi:hypothetical protein